MTALFDAFDAPDVEHEPGRWISLVIARGYVKMFQARKSLITSFRP
jgi:hypothetical protein